MLEKCTKHQLCLGNWRVNALAFWPICEQNKEPWGAIFTHGYTSHKGDLINWSLKLLELKIPSIIFDLPGHYLGSFNEVESLEEFQQNAPQLFEHAYQILKTPKIILGGHSLGALLALQAHRCPTFSSLEKIFIAVGLGLKAPDEKNSLAGPFMDHFLKTRSHLVSKALATDAIYPWIQNSKQNLSISNQTIHLLTGLDDYVVSPKGCEFLKGKLQAQNNKVTLNKPTKLPHNHPERAAVFIKKFLKEFITQT